MSRTLGSSFHGFARLGNHGRISGLAATVEHFCNDITPVGVVEIVLGPAFWAEIWVLGPAEAEITNDFATSIPMGSSFVDNVP
jgi:hypothetical protein